MSNKAVVYFSMTGNTKIVANLFEGYDQLEIKTNHYNPQKSNVEFTEIPDIKQYSEVVFAAPTHGARMAKPMRLYLEQIDTLEGKQIHAFTTHFFPFKWLGGKQTLKQFKKIIESKKGIVDKLVSIEWKSKKREKIILDMLNEFNIKKALK